MLFTQRIRHANLFSMQNVPNDFPDNTSKEKQRKQAGNYRNTLKSKLFYSFLTRAVPMRGSGSLKVQHLEESMLEPVNLWRSSA